MPASPADSAIYRDLLGDPEIAALFTDSAELRAMLVVEGALAKVQGDLGVIPEDAATAIHAASLEVQLDPAALAEATGQNGVPVPGLVAAFREAMGTPEAQYLHWGATSQDIMDTGQVLRLRQAFGLCDDRLGLLLARLADLAETYAELPMAARTYGQAAVPTSFGAVVAGWGRPVLAAKTALPGVTAPAMCVSLGGAAGTLSAMGEAGPEVRRALAQALGLSDPGTSWHTDRTGVAGLSSWAAGLAGALGKMGEDLILMTQTGIGEVRLRQSGGSSTMPQKANPVLPSVLVAIARQVQALDGVMQGARLHRQQRDGAAWISEWMNLPQICILTGRALAIAQTLSTGIKPVPDAMTQNLEAGAGAIHAEAITFALARTMPRPDAARAVASMVQKAQEGGADLRTRAKSVYPDLILPERSLGTAPTEARAFATAARG